jgi:hypothetical protein
MRRGPLVLCVLVGAALLTGCSNDPNPSSSSKANYASTHFAVSKAGDPFVVDGCQVQVHRVTTASTDALPDFTLAVARCPTATVTVENNNCGKSCMSNTIAVLPTLPVFDVQNGPADDATRAAQLSQAQATAAYLTERQTAARAARINELHARVGQLTHEIEQLEGPELPRR